jgi:Beta-ketoacyl synthase, N-terminal domain
MTGLSMNVQGVGVLGPGLIDWPATRAVLRGETLWQSAPAMLAPPAILPAAERRRAGRIIKLALAIGAQAVGAAQADAVCLPTVFTSAGGDGENCHDICTSLASSERRISPTRFHNSVHNAAAGYWGIAYGCSEPSVSLCAYDASFGAGLLEAAVQLAGGAPSVLLVAYDVDYPPPLRGRRPIPDTFGVAMVLTAIHAPGTSPAMARLSIDLSAQLADLLDSAPLEEMRRSIPAARVLPLLASLARRRAGRVVLDYLNDTRLAVDVSFDA